MNAPLPPYTVEQLASGSYDVLLAGIVIASLVRSVGRGGADDEWQVELLDELPPFKRPDPFVDLSHTFRSLAAALEWLGILVHDGSVATSFQEQQA